MIAIFFLTSIYIISEAFRDYKYIDDNVFIKHSEGAIVRASVLIAISVLSFGVSLKALFLLLWLSSYFWILFDLALNYFRELPVFYIGKNSYLDKKFQGRTFMFIFTKALIFVGFYVLFNTVKA